MQCFSRFTKYLWATIHGFLSSPSILRPQAHLHNTFGVSKVSQDVMLEAQPTWSCHQASYRSLALHPTRGVLKKGYQSTAGSSISQFICWGLIDCADTHSTVRAFTADCWTPLARDPWVTCSILPAAETPPELCPLLPNLLFSLRPQFLLTV